MASMIFNGSPINGIYFNGNELEEVYFNGNLVFKKSTPEFHLRDKAATASVWNENIYSTADEMLAALNTVKTSYGTVKFDIEIEYID